MEALVRCLVDALSWQASSVCGSGDCAISCVPQGIMLLIHSRRGNGAAPLLQMPSLRAGTCLCRQHESCSVFSDCAPQTTPVAHQALSRAGAYVPLKLLSIEDGRVLRSLNHLLHRTKKIDFIEIFNEKLLVKQVRRVELVLVVSRSGFRVGAHFCVKAVARHVVSGVVWLARTHP